jgi:acyl-CoA reductase-like NAD-dependent aldehyde dehydrogenase
MHGSFDRHRWELVIAGRLEPAEEEGWSTVRNPATNESFAEVPIATEADVDRAVGAARAAFDGGKWARAGGPRRGQLLFALAALLRENFQALAELETRCNGKAIASSKGEIGQAIAELEFYAGAASKIMGESVPTPHGFAHYTVREPLGVCALIVPWNYPFMLAMRKVAPALAAGNAVVLKPASATPLSALALGELAIEAGFPEGALNVITGPGGSAGNALVTHPGVDKVSFTGSTENGREILRAAADDFRRVTLELGGKSPNLIFDDADLDAAVPGSVWSIFYSAGQSCEARSRLLVQSTVYDEFVERFVAATRRLTVGDPLDPAIHIGALISPSHLASVRAAIDGAKARGGIILAGGSPPEGEQFQRGNWLKPTIIAGLPNDDPACQEEIFGPVVTISSFDTESDAIRLANDTIYGLAASVWTADARRAMRVPAAIRSGVVTVNQPFTVFPGTPFGGFKQSGWGREASLHALDDYTELKSVVAYSGTRPVDPFGIGG